MQLYCCCSDIQGGGGDIGRSFYPRHWYHPRCVLPPPRNRRPPPPACSSLSRRARWLLLCAGETRPKSLWLLKVNHLIWFLYNKLSVNENRCATFPQAVCVVCFAGLRYCALIKRQLHWQLTVTPDDDGLRDWRRCTIIWYSGRVQL